MSWKCKHTFGAIAALAATAALVFGFAGSAVAQDSDCDVLDPAFDGAAWGLCKAYCEAMDCAGDPRASQKACDKVLSKFDAQGVGSIPCGNTLVFVTSTTHDGDLGGLAGGDAICNERATAGDLQSAGDQNFFAWLSDNSTNARDRIPQAGPYVKNDGLATIIAEDLVDLTNGNIGSPIDHDEFGSGPFTTTVWTGTLASGNLRLHRNCAGWTQGSGSHPSLWGQTNKTNAGWTSFRQCVGGSSCCVGPRSIMCFGR